MAVQLRTRRDNDGSFIGELRGGRDSLHTKTKSGAVQVTVWAGDAATTCVGAGQYGGATTGRAARREHAASTGRESGAVHASGRGPRRADRRTEAGPGGEGYDGGSGRGARHVARRRARGRKRLAPAYCST
jgi:hypothetical protein